MITKLTSNDYSKAAKLYQEHYPCDIRKVIHYMKLKGIKLIIKKGREIIGMIVAPESNLNAGTIEISLLAVKSEERGKGIGSKLLMELEKEAVNQKKQVILTYTLNAKEFYKKKGYKTFAQDKTGTYLIKSQIVREKDSL